MTPLRLLALALASAFATSVALSNWTMRFAGQLNHPSLGFNAFIICMILGFVLGIVVMGVILFSQSERSQVTIRIGSAAIVLAPLLFVFNLQDSFGAFVDGFAQWADTNRHLGDWRDRVISDAALTAPVPLPMDWPHSDGMPKGVPLEIANWPTPFQQASVDEVWVLRKGVLLVWRDTFNRFVYYSSMEGESPTELESPILFWQSIGHGTMVGVAYPH